MSHIRKSFTSQFSKDARGHLIKIEDIVEPIPTLPTGTKFCEHSGKYDCCKKKVCFNNSYCGVRDFIDKKQKAESLGYNWNH